MYYLNLVKFKTKIWIWLVDHIKAEADRIIYILRNSKVLLSFIYLCCLQHMKAAVPFSWTDETFYAYPRP